MYKSPSPILYIYLFFDFERERADEKLGLDCRVAVHHVHADVSVPAQSAEPVHGGPCPGRAVGLGGRRLKRHVTLSRGQDFGWSFTGRIRPGRFARAYRHGRAPFSVAVRSGRVRPEDNFHPRIHRIIRITTKTNSSNENENTRRKSVFFFFFYIKLLFQKNLFVFRSETRCGWYVRMHSLNDYIAITVVSIIIFHVYNLKHLRYYKRS